MRAPGGGPPFAATSIRTLGNGIAVSIRAPSLMAVLAPRSGLATRNRIVFANQMGIIDSDCQDEAKAALWNAGSVPYTVEPGDRVRKPLMATCAILAEPKDERDDDQMSELLQDDMLQPEDRARRPYRGRSAEYEAKHGKGSWAKRMVCLPKLPESEMLEMIERKLGEYSRLEADWDGYDALPASTDSLRDARTFIDQRPAGVRLPYPGLETNGEVGFMWEYGNICAAVNLEGDGTFYFFARFRNTDGSEDVRRGEDYRVDSEWPENLVELLKKID